jgi:hypothetical protein
MKTNFVICSYGGKYYNRHYDESETFKYTYLRYYLRALNLLWDKDSTVEQITIMKPKINPEHPPLDKYYEFDDLKLDKIRDKIKIIECENKGASYGQFFTAIENDRKEDNIFDYYIFTEDDYMPMLGKFDRLLIDNYDKKNSNFLCLSMNHTSGKNHMTHFFGGINTHVPDFAIGIIDKNSIEKMYQKWTYESIMKTILHPGYSYHVSQIAFGYIFTIAGIETRCLAEKHLALFNCNGNPVKFLLINFEMHDRNIQRAYKGEKYEIPIFVPIDLFYIPKKKEFYDLLIKYLVNESEFNEYYNILNHLAENENFN